jgi:hypothetical protein
MAWCAVAPLEPSRVTSETGPGPEGRSATGRKGHELHSAKKTRSTASGGVSVSEAGSRDSRRQQAHSAAAADTTHGRRHAGRRTQAGVRTGWQALACGGRQQRPADPSGESEGGPVDTTGLGPRAHEQQRRTQACGSSGPEPRTQRHELISMGPQPRQRVTRPPTQRTAHGRTGAGAHHWRMARLSESRACCGHR